MAQTVKHLKTSSIPDGSDVNQVQPSDWNANHVITGSVDQSQVANLVSDLALKAPLADPIFTGNARAVTPTAGDADTSIATTAFVADAVIAAGVTPIAPGFRNRIINGDFSVDQRYVGVQVVLPAGTPTYGPDRWYGYTITPAVIGLQRVADTINNGEFYMNVGVGTIDATLAAGDASFIGQSLEGHMLRGLSWGNAQAKQITVSFTAWANANYTLALAIRNGASNNRSYVTTFAVTTTRQRFTFVIPGDVTGTWAYDASKSLDLTIGLASGTTFHASSLNTWLAGNFVSHSSCSNFMAGSNSFNIKDVQLEAGATPTEFERLPRPEQILRCLRYYQELGPIGLFPRLQGYCGAIGNYLIVPITFLAPMRIPPSVSKLGTWNASGTTNQPAASSVNPSGFNMAIQASAVGMIDTFPTANDQYFTCNAEL